MPSQAHAGAAQEAPDIGQWEGQDVPLVRPSSCNVKGGIPSSRKYLPTYLYRLRARLSIDVKKSRFGAKNRQIGRREHSALRRCAKCGTCQMASISAAGHSHGSLGRYIAPSPTNCGSTGSYGPRLGRRDGSRGFFLVGPFFFS